MDEEISCEDRFVSFRSVPTLENIALVTLVGNTWSVREFNEHVRDNYEESYYHEADTEIEQYLSDTEEKMMDNLGKFLPPKLLGKAGYFVKPMGRQTLRWLFWIKCDFPDVFYSVDFDAVCWKMDGTMDRLKTFELLFAQNNKGNVRELFYMACHNCNQARIVDLWRKMPKSIKAQIRDSAHNFFLISYWIGFVEAPGRLTKARIAAYFSNEEKSKDELGDSIKAGNLEGVKFFWGKLSDRVKSDNVFSWIESSIEKMDVRPYDVYQAVNGHTDILCFLLSQMCDHEQQGKVFQEHTDTILKALLNHWPWQVQLLPATTAMFHFICGETYFEFLANVALQIKAGRTTQLLLRELWCESPLHLKASVISFMVEMSSGDMLSLELFWRLFHIGDLATIRLILKEASVEEKKQITFSVLASENKKLFYGLIYSYDFKFFEMLFEETLSDIDIVEFKEKLIEKYGEKLSYPWIGEVDLKPLEVILDWCFPSREQVKDFEKKIILQHVALKEAVRKGDCAKIEELFRWCIKAAGNVDLFKAEFSAGSTATELAEGGWNLFEKILKWCFNSAKGIDEFKKKMLRNDSMLTTLSSMFMKYNFSFAFHLLNWCDLAKVDITPLKKKFLISVEANEIFEFYITDRCMFSKDVYHRWELVKNLARWFHPMDKDTISLFQTEFKDLSFLFDDHEKECKKLFHIVDKFSAETGRCETDDDDMDDSDAYETDDSNMDDSDSYETDDSNIEFVYGYGSDMDD